MTDTYVHQDYPKWKYHATQPARLVKTREEENALTEEWADHPDAVPKPEPGATYSYSLPDDPGDTPKKTKGK